jgi:hypothetical protein
MVIVKKVIYNPITDEKTFIEVEEEVEVEDINSLKNYKFLQLMDVYKSKIEEGLISSITGTSILYGYKDQDQLNYSKLANLFALNPTKESTILGTMSHGVISMTREQFINFMDDAETFEIGLYTNRKQIEAQINNATTIDELNDVVMSL